MAVENNQHSESIEREREHVLQDAFVSGLAGLATSYWNFEGDEYFDSNLVPDPTIQLSPDFAVVNKVIDLPDDTPRRNPVYLSEGETAVLRGFIPFQPKKDDGQRAKLIAEVNGPQPGKVTIYSIE